MSDGGYDSSDVWVSDERKQRPKRRHIDTRKRDQSVRRIFLADIFFAIKIIPARADETPLELCTSVYNVLHTGSIVALEIL